MINKINKINKVKKEIFMIWNKMRNLNSKLVYN